MSNGAIILAAGNASRMGNPKWQLKMPNGEPFYQFLCNRYKLLGCETVLVTNSHDYETIIRENQSNSFSIAINKRVDLGRLYSLQCGLKLLSDKKLYFIQNIDNPYVSNDLITQLIEGVTEHDFALPEYQGRGGHPLIISKAIAEKINQITEPYPDLREVLGQFKGNRIPFNNPNILLNINTPEDYERFLHIE
jgi:molybdenum cofactor cytidylyltransferase